MCVRALIGASVVCCRGWEGWDENVGLPQWHKHYHTSVARQTGSNLQRRGFSQQGKQICEGEQEPQSLLGGVRTKGVTLLYLCSPSTPSARHSVSGSHRNLTDLIQLRPCDVPRLGRCELILSVYTPESLSQTKANTFIGFQDLVCCDCPAAFEVSHRFMLFTYSCSFSLPQITTGCSVQNNFSSV